MGDYFKIRTDGFPEREELLEEIEEKFGTRISANSRTASVLAALQAALRWIENKEEWEKKIEELLKNYPGDIHPKISI